MIRKFMMSIAMTLCLMGHFHALKAQCSTCPITKQFNLKDVVICQKDGNFHYSRSATLFRDVDFITSGFAVTDPADRFSIDFDDGAGFQQTDGARVFSIHYASTGPKNIRIKQGSGNKVKDEFTLLVKQPAADYEKPDEIWKVETPQIFVPNPTALGATSAVFPDNGAIFMAASKGVGHAYIKYGNPQKKLKKPIIFVDGIDFNSEEYNYHDTSDGSEKSDANLVRHGVTGWDIFSMGAEDGWSKVTPNASEDFRMYPQVFQNLRSAGYDIIFLDFAEGATWIQKNAQVLKQLLQMVNEEKARNGSKYENIIVGPSMGGQVARIALAEMERDGESHCTKMYVSFDSPHQGAHIPLGIQSMAWAAFDSELDCETWPKLNKPAARQLLIYNLANEVSKGNISLEKTMIETPINTASLPILVKPSRETTQAISMNADGGTIRNNYMNYLQQLGYPKQCNNLAITNGNIDGKAMNINPGEQVFDGNIHITDASSVVIDILQNLLKITVFSQINPKFTISPTVADKLGIWTPVTALQIANTIPIVSTYGLLNDLVPDDRKRLLDLKMYSLPGTNNPAGIFNLHAGCLPTQGDFLHLNYKFNDNENVLFEMAVPMPDPNDIPCGYFAYTTKVNNTALAGLLHLDHVPGGGRKDLIGIEDLVKDKGITKLTKKIDATVGAVNGSNQREAECFIPVFSALDLQLPLTNANLSEPIESKISANKLITPFEQHYGQISDNKNLNHVEVDDLMRLKVLSWLDEYQDDLVLANTLPSQYGDIYNYGLWRKRIPSISINANGKLLVNDDGGTAFDKQEGLAIKPIYEAWLAGCGGAIVDVNTGGVFAIGSYSSAKKGIVHVPKYSRINVQGGTLRLQKGSELLLENNSGAINLNVTAGITELHDNSKIVVQNGANFTVTGGTVSCNDQSQIIIESGGVMNISGGLMNIFQDSKIIVKSGGILNISNGQLKNMDYGQLIVESGAQININDTGSLLTYGNSLTEISGSLSASAQSHNVFSDESVVQGTGNMSFLSGYLEVSSLAQVRVYQHGTMVINSSEDIHLTQLGSIEGDGVYATIRMESSNATPVVFNGSSSTGDNSPIILKNCKWVVNTPVWVNHSAFLQIIGSPVITANTLTIKGSGKVNSGSFKMMELMQSANLRVPKDLNFNNGIIIYQNGTDGDETSIELGAKPYTSAFTNILFKGLELQGQHTIAITNPSIRETGEISISQCLFEDLDRCLYIKQDDFSNNPFDNIYINNTSAERFRVLAIDVSARTNVTIQNSHFISSKKVPAYASVGSAYAPALKFSNNNRHYQIIVKNSIIESTVQWQEYPAWVNNEFVPGEDYSASSPLYPPQNLAMEALEDSYLVGAFGVAHLFLKNGTEVKNGYIGVVGRISMDDGCPASANISILGCSSIHHNYTGILMHGLQDLSLGCGQIIYGGILMDGGQIDNNTFGIYGKNVFIDANFVTLLNKNTFGISNDVGHYMCISYSSTISPTGPNGLTPIVNGNLQAPHNYWKSGAPKKDFNYLLSGYSMNYAPAESTSFDCSSPSGLVHNEDPNDVYNNASEETRANVIVGGDTISLLPKYWKGINEYITGDLAAAELTMSEITAIPLSVIQNSSNKYVHQFHTTAWTIAPKNNTPQNKIQSSSTENFGNVVIYPNPTDDNFGLTLPAGKYSVSITDLLGIIIKQVDIRESDKISTDGINSGIYQVIVQKQGEK
ncbi:MAG: T9SS type A sorting domain-containing protein, partial [Saprospiraceae bacterium]